MDYQNIDNFYLLKFKIYFNFANIKNNKLNNKCCQRYRNFTAIK